MVELVEEDMLALTESGSQDRDAGYVQLNNSSKLHTSYLVYKSPDLFHDLKISGVYYL